MVVLKTGQESLVQFIPIALFVKDPLLEESEQEGLVSYDINPHSESERYDYLEKVEKK